MSNREWTEWPRAAGWHIYHGVDRVCLVYFFYKKGCLYPRSTPLKSKKYWKITDGNFTAKFARLFSIGAVPALDASEQVFQVMQGTCKDLTPQQVEMCCRIFISDTFGYEGPQHG